MLIASASANPSFLPEDPTNFKCVEGTISLRLVVLERVDQAFEQFGPQSILQKGFASTTCLSCPGFTKE